MKAIIPVAGFGTRLRPHTYSRPKPLINVAGKPVLGHILDGISEVSLEEIIFVVGHLGDQIERYVRGNYGFVARFIQQEDMLGQAHAIHLAHRYVEGPLLIVFADTIFDTDLSVLHEVEDDGLVFAKEVKDPRRFGVVVVKNGHIRRFIEKPATTEHNLAVIGLYFIRDASWLMDSIVQLMRRGKQTKGEYYLADALQIMIERGARIGVQAVSMWQDCGTPESLLRTNRYLLTHGHASVDQIAIQDSVVIPPVYVAPTARIQRAIIGPYAAVADDSAISDGIVRDSIIDEAASIERVVLHHSLVGREARVTGAYERFNVGDSSTVDHAAHGA